MSHPASTSSFSTLRLNMVLAGFLLLSAPASTYIVYRQPPSGQSRVYQVTQLRTDGVHCRESAGTGPAVLGVYPVTGAVFSGITMDHVMRASLFLRPLMYIDV